MAKRQLLNNFITKEFERIRIEIMFAIILK